MSRLSRLSPFHMSIGFPHPGMGMCAGGGYVSRLERGWD
jgi:hypothetical protein